MISAINSSPSNLNLSFTSVIPVKVFIDGMETRDAKHIRQSCRQLNNLLMSTISDDRQQSIINKFAKHDKDYKHIVTKRPSDYIRNLINRTGAFIFTGFHALKMEAAGKAVGKAETAFDKMFAKHSYGYTADHLKRPNRCIPETLNIHMTSNGKYGLSTFKIKLDDISFIS